MASKARLHSCKTERFKINLPPLAVEEKGIVEEAIWLMRRHFFQSFSDATWESLRAEIRHFSDPSVALSTLMEKFGCPYTRFIPTDAMTTRQRNIKGEMGTTGIELGRRWLPPREIMSNFLDWMGTLSLSTSLRSPAFLLSSAKFLFDTATPIAAATIVYNTRKSAVSSTSSSTFSRMLTVPVCRFLYTACVIFAIVTTTCRIASVAHPLHILSLDYPSMEGESALPSFSRRGSGSDDRGGLCRGDILSHVEGERIRSFWSSRSVLRKLNDGEVGSTLRVTTLRRKRAPMASSGEVLDKGTDKGTDKGSRLAGLDSRSVVVQRHAEIISNVKSELLSSAQGAGLGYLAIDEFTEKTREEVERALKTMKEAVKARDGDRQSLNALVIDLRGNPGGPIGSAFDVASLFLGSGTILSRTCTHRERESLLGRISTRLWRSRNRRRIRGEEDEQEKGTGHTVEKGARQARDDDPERIKRLLRTAETHSSLNSLPDRHTSLLLLMDDATASASEIMIAALACTGRAETMGTRTKGKNVAQALVQMSDGSGLAFTIREYLDPLGGYMGDGITPKIPTAGLGLGDRELVGRIVHREGEWSLI